MLESIKALWVSHQIANQAQFPKQTELLVGDWVKSNKDQWWDRDLPAKQEFWKYVKFDALKSKEYDVVPPAAINNRVTQPNNETVDIEINDLSQASNWLIDSDYVVSLPQLLADSGELQKWSKFIGSDWQQNYFSAINRSFLFSGLAIWVPKDKKVTFNIAINCQNGGDAFLPFQLWLNVEMGSKVNILETVKSESENAFVLYDRMMNLSESSTVSFVQAESGSGSSHIVQNLDAQVARGASLNNFAITLPSFWSRHNLDIKLNESTANANIFGLYLNDGNNFSDHHTSISHNKPDTHSRQYYKGILAGKCRSVFNGKVYIAEGASKSNSEQLNKNLLLSDKAEIDTKPELQIYNDDVKAAHGATIGQLDPEELFYLMSRGMSYENSWNLLCNAFAVDLFEEFPDMDLEFFKKQVGGALEQMRIANGL